MVSERKEPESVRKMCVKLSVKLVKVSGRRSDVGNKEPPGNMRRNMWNLAKTFKVSGKRSDVGKESFMDANKTFANTVPLLL